MPFKNQYYCFIAGLPDISFDGVKLPFTPDQFRAILDEELKPDDKKLFNRYFLKRDNETVITPLKNRDAAIGTTDRYYSEDLLNVVSKINENLPIDDKGILPDFHCWLNKWVDETESQESGKMWEDLLTSLYMDYGREAKNSLLSGWFELNLNIGNILAAIYARKHRIDIAEYIVGTNSTAELIRENANSRDFGIGSEPEYFNTIQRYSEEEDIYERERKIDQLRWEWLDNNTIFDYFNIEYIFAYLCKLEILNRWVSFNAQEGERLFRELIATLKNETEIPDDF